MKTQGSYKFFTRSIFAEGMVRAQMKIEADPSKPQVKSGTNVCVLGPGGPDSGDRVGDFGPFFTTSGPMRFGEPVYLRYKCTDMIQIILDFTNSTWRLQGSNDNLPPMCLNYDANPAVTCWGCGSDYDCTETIIEIPYSDAVLCNPAATAPTGTADSCSRLGEACGPSAQCCNNNACVDNVCTRTCFNAGDACTSNSNCCSNSCVSGACEGGTTGGGGPERPLAERRNPGSD